MTSRRYGDVTSSLERGKLFSGKGFDREFMIGCYCNRRRIKIKSHLTIPTQYAACHTYHFKTIKNDLHQIQIQLSLAWFPGLTTFADIARGFGIPYLLAAWHAGSCSTMHPKESIVLACGG